MARKNLLKDLLAPLPEAPGGGMGGAGEPPALPGGRGTARGAIGAVSRGIADLKARAVVDIDPGLIDEGGLPDRIGHDAGDHARLLASLRDHGQQVPVLVRPHPAAPGRYQIVYGRRRVLALRELGLPVKALVRGLDDLGLVLAQGQENAVRRDLSFIEKAHFAQAMVEAGFERRVVCEALAIDKTAISRMLSVTERVPPAVIAAVGAAPGVGRERWLALAGLYAADPVDADAVRALLAKGKAGTKEAAASPDAGPDAGFEALESWLRERTRRSREASGGPAPESIATAGGEPLAALSRKRGTLTLTLRGEGFGDWLVENLASLHARWREEREGEGPES